MLRAAALSIAQLGDAAILRVLAKTVLLTLLLFALAGGLLAELLDGADPCGAIGLDACVLGGGESGAAATVAVLAGLWLLFPAVAIGVVSLFSDEVVAAVERRHYPAAAATARPLGWGAGIALGLRASGRLLLYNVVALPFYVLLLVTGIGPLLLFLGVNALALGRDLGETVAARHLGRAERRAWIARSKGPRAALGLATTGLFLLPLVNLLAPVLGAAMATHLFHGRR